MQYCKLNTFAWEKVHHRINIFVYRTWCPRDTKNSLIQQEKEHKKLLFKFQGWTNLFLTNFVTARVRSTTGR